MTKEFFLTLGTAAILTMAPKADLVLGKAIDTGDATSSLAHSLVAVTQNDTNNFLKDQRHVSALREAANEYYDNAVAPPDSTEAERPAELTKTKAVNEILKEVLNGAGSSPSVGMFISERYEWFLLDNLNEVFSLENNRFLTKANDVALFSKLAKEGIKRLACPQHFSHNTATDFNGSTKPNEAIEDTPLEENTSPDATAPTPDQQQEVHIPIEEKADPNKAIEDTPLGENTSHDAPALAADQVQEIHIPTEEREESFTSFFQLFWDAEKDHLSDKGKDVANIIRLLRADKNDSWVIALKAFARASHYNKDVDDTILDEEEFVKFALFIAKLKRLNSDEGDDWRNSLVEVFDPFSGLNERLTRKTFKIDDSGTMISVSEVYNMGVRQELKSRFPIILEAVVREARKAFYNGEYITFDEEDDGENNILS